MDSGLHEYTSVAMASGGRVEPLLDALAALDPAGLLPQPGGGSTAERFRALASVAAVDVTAARVLEPHVDALAILDEAGWPPPPRGTTWGVFAAEAPDARLEATRRDDRWVLTGRKAWCSLAGRLTDALVTADVGGGERRMFAVRLTDPGVRPENTVWAARGLAAVVSGPVAFDAVEGEPVGGDGWYLDRPGFRWGAIGVAACWWGGCLPLFDAVLARSRSRPDDALVAARAGALFRALHNGRLVLLAAADAIDRRAGADAALAHGVRGTVADAVAYTLDAVRDVLGPSALALDEESARRCADLEVYVSQYHRGRDDVSLAGHLTEGSLAW